MLIIIMKIYYYRNYSWQEYWNTEKWFINKVSCK